MIEQLSNLYAPSGREEDVRNRIIEELEDFYKNIKIDNLGNLIIHKPGKKKKIAITAPMDEVSFIVTHTKTPDLVVATSVGDVNPSALQNIAVRDANGRLLILDSTGNKADKIGKIRNLNFKIISKCKVDELDTMFLSNTLIFDNKLQNSGGNFVGKALERSVCCSVLCNLARILTDSLYEYYFIFTSYNYCDKKGAHTATYNVEIDELYNLCCVDADNDTVKSGMGPVVVLRDKLFVSPNNVNEKFDKFNKKQTLVANSLVCEAGIFQKQFTTESVYALGVPVNYLYSPNEVVNQEDIEATYEMLKEAVLP